MNQLVKNGTVNGNIVKKSYYGTKAEKQTLNEDLIGFLRPSLEDLRHCSST